MHWYRNNKRFTDKNKDWPLTKKGEKSKRPKNAQLFAVGAVIGVTSILANFGNAHWMPKYFGEMGIQAGLDCDDFKSALKRFHETRNKPADEGTDIHAIIADALGQQILSDDPRFEPMMEGITSFLESIKVDECVIEDTFTADIQGYKYGGTVDIISDNVIIDWKSCKEGRVPMWKECAQLAAYDRCKGRDCYNVYIDRETWRISFVKKWTQEQIKYGWALFQLNYDAGEILRMKI